jgi:alkaline phosphatase D
MYVVLSLLMFSLSAFSLSNDERVQQLKSVRSVAFGSCNNQNDIQPLWKDIMAQKPDLWIWGGDIIYADWGKIQSVDGGYQKLNANPDYQAFKAQIPMIGTWDDHDYAFNNANGSAAIKKESQKLFLDFLDVPVDSPRRTQEGVYHAINIGEGDQKIKFIMLDNRYFKDLEPEYAMLGKTQWDWLENEFKTSTANLHVIVTGLSIFSPLMPYTDEWWQYPKEVNRLLDLLKKYNVKAPLFLTGDKHFSSIFKYSGQLEFMSSGMTHTAPRKTWWYLGRKYPNTYFGLSYGRFDIDWEGNIPKLKLFMRNGDRDIHTTKVIWKNNTWTFLSKSQDPPMVTDPHAHTDEEFHQ